MRPGTFKALSSGRRRLTRERLPCERRSSRQRPCAPSTDPSADCPARSQVAAVRLTVVGPLPVQVAANRLPNVFDLFVAPVNPRAPQVHPRSTACLRATLGLCQPDLVSVPSRALLLHPAIGRSPPPQEAGVAPRSPGAGWRGRFSRSRASFRRAGLAQSRLSRGRIDASFIQPFRIDLRPAAPGGQAGSSQPGSPTRPTPLRSGRRRLDRC